MIAFISSIAALLGITNFTLGNLITAGVMLVVNALLAVAAVKCAQSMPIISVLCIFLAATIGEVVVYLRQNAT